MRGSGLWLLFGGRQELSRCALHMGNMGRMPTHVIEYMGKMLRPRYWIHGQDAHATMVEES